MSTLIAMAVLGIVLDRLGYLQPARLALQTLVAPVQAALTDVAGEAVSLSQSAQDIRQLQADNEELQALVDRLRVENVQLTELQRENQILRQLLNYTRSNPEFDYVAAGVAGRTIGSDPSNLLFYIFVDVGARQGVAPDMPVITERGLVGRVTAVGPNSAQVLMLIDPASTVNARLQNSGVTGLVRGQLDGSLIMERIPQGENVNPGDIVLTSGLGGNFPPNLVIGQVTEVTQRDLDIFQTAHIRPTVDFGKLEIVLALTAFEPVDYEREIFGAQESGN
ncbi:MAG: rod shape-determining protein MreC [Anaerolineae bacterium]